MLVEPLLQALRLALSFPRTTLQLCMVGLVAGFISAVVIIIFRLTLVMIQTQVLGSVGNYTSLNGLQLWLLPVLSTIIVVCIALLTGFKHYRLGIPFVIHRLKMHYGHIPLATSVNQFFGGILALASGFVVGKEGPTVHLAAAASHYIGRYLSLPFNSLRILAGCGIAAGISAAFNTPFAAVIFVMEVVMREYKVHIFVPIMLAAAVGSVLTRIVFGDSTELAWIYFSHLPYWHYPIFILLGIFLGLLGSLFNKQLMLTMKLFRPLNMINRLLIAAIITGTVGVFLPEALGSEFINIKSFIDSSPHLSTISTLFIAKFLLAVVAIALGVPGGIIGSVMAIGLLAGFLFFQPIMMLLHDLRGSIPQAELYELTLSYALLGLAGMLAVVLHAPLAALAAAMELSTAQQVILPALITIVTGYVTSKQFCNNRSIFIQQLEYQKLPYTTTLIRDELQNTGVMALMASNIRVFQDGQDADMYGYLQSHPNQLLINQTTQQLLPDNIKKNSGSTNVDLSQKSPYKWQLIELDISLEKNAYPITSHTLNVVSDQNTLAEVYELLYKKRHGGVVIVQPLSKLKVEQITNEIGTHTTSEQLIMRGVITWNMLHSYILRQQH